MWRPTRTPQTADDDEGDSGETARETAGGDSPDDAGPADGTSTGRLWAAMAGLGLVVGVAGWVVGRAGLSVVAATGLDGGLVGFTLTTAISSLPELVVLVTAVRMGQLTLGVGNIIGGNAYDTLMIAVADIVYGRGSLYVDAGPTSLVLLGGTVMMTATLTAGLVMRERRWIGFEGVSIPLIYLGTIALVVWT
jgi:cation:H+ antiporter